MTIDMMKRPWRYDSDETNGVPGENSTPPVVELTDEQVNAYLVKNNMTALPVDEYQRQLDEAASTAQRRPATPPDTSAADAETKRLADLRWSDPPAYEKEVRERMASEVAQQTREIITLPGQIMADVREKCPGLPEAEYKKLERIVNDPSNTPEMLKNALSTGQVVREAKSVKLDLIEKGVIRPGTGSRPPNDSEPAPTHTPAAPDTFSTGANKLAAALAGMGVKAEDIKASEYARK